MHIIGITGGIGSGKSKVLYDLEHNYGAFVCESDKLAHNLMKRGQSIYANVVKAFGEEILDESLEIDRQKLGKLVFADDDKLKLLNGVVHPGVKEYILNDISLKEKEGLKLYVIEAALLIQDGYKSICDEIWYVWASKETRIKRLMEYRNYTYEKCIAVMDNQYGDEYFRENTDFVIDNDSDYDVTSKQLNGKLKKLLGRDIIN